MKDTNIPTISWNIAEAKQKFSDVVRQAAREPQAIYNRERLVAVVVDAKVFEDFEAWRARQHARSLHDTFAELRDLLVQDETGGLDVPARKDRPNALLDVQDELAG